jgi:hypothetical protein
MRRITGISVLMYSRSPCVPDGRLQFFVFKARNGFMLLVFAVSSSYYFALNVRCAISLLKDPGRCQAKMHQPVLVSRSVLYPANWRYQWLYILFTPISHYLWVYSSYTSYAIGLHKPHLGNAVVPSCKGAKAFGKRYLLSRSSALSLLLLICDLIAYSFPEKCSRLHRIFVSV